MPKLTDMEKALAEEIADLDEQIRGFQIAKEALEKIRDARVKKSKASEKTS